MYQKLCRESDEIFGNAKSSFSFGLYLSVLARSKARHTYKEKP